MVFAVAERFIAECWRDEETSVATFRFLEELA